MPKTNTDRAREAFERNMQGAAQKTRSVTESAASILKSRISWLAASVVALVSGIAAFAANIENLQTRLQTYLDQRAYLATLQHPYPALLDKDVIAQWSSGRAQLALFQIDGYRGKLKEAPAWIKFCLTSPLIFPETAATQFNSRYAVEESFIDRQNKLNLEHRLDQLDTDRSEESATLTINDPFSKLLARSKYQLLSRYKNSELTQLDKTELYLLRNAIYGSHGYSFYTTKLYKYVARMGWSAPEYKPDLMSPVERCNAFFLQELHPNQELGALGRGVLITDSNPNPTAFVRPAICACLAQPKIHVDCQREPRGNTRTDFRESVDLILNIEQGPANKIEWTFVDERDVAAADNDIFRHHQEKFYAAALDFNVAVQTVLESEKQSLNEITDAKRGPFWGVKLIISPDTQSAMTRSPAFTHKLSENICNVVHRSLELTGPFIPRMVNPIPFRPEPNNPVTEIYDKPIVFNDLRISLTKDYIKKHYGISPVEIEFTPSILLVHISNTNDLQKYYETVRNPALPAASPGDRSAGTAAATVNPSTHYVVDRDGTIFNFMKDFQIARHSIGLDRHAIGITVIGDGEQPLTEAQVASSALLARYLKKKYSDIGWLIDEAEAFSLQGTALWEETLPFDKPKETDLERDFMKNLRGYLGDLQFKSL